MYLNPLKVRFKKYATLPVMHNVQSNLVTIMGFNRVLNEELADEVAKPVELQRVGAVFVRLADYAKMYTQFCGAQPHLLANIEEDRKIDKVM